jgi:hypothetical protein
MNLRAVALTSSRSGYVKTPEELRASSAIRRWMRGDSALRTTLGDEGLRRSALRTTLGDEGLRRGCKGMPSAICGEICGEIDDDAPWSAGSSSRSRTSRLRRPAGLRLWRPFEDGVPLVGGTAMGWEAVLTRRPASCCGKMTSDSSVRLLRTASL